MKKRIVLIGISIGILFLIPFSAMTAEAAKKPVKVVFMTSPMGTAAYNIGAAFEQVFQKAGSWVKIKHQETPGGMYMYRYISKNRQKMISGEIPHTIATNGVAAIAHLAEGRWPFKKFSWPTTKTMISTGLMAGLYGVYDKDIKSLKDFSGKRVCTYERARVFFGLLSDKPLFGRGVGNFKQIDWARLGLAGCKDAFLNGKVDVTPLTFRGSVLISDSGQFIIPKLQPSSSTMEILSHGRKIYFIGVPADLIKKSYDPAKTILVQAGLIKKDAYKGIDRDYPTKISFGTISCDESLPDDIVVEMTRVRHEYRAEFGKYHAAMKLFPENPYPLGTPKKFVHPGVFKAMHKLGIPIPVEQ